MLYLGLGLLNVKQDLFAKLNLLYTMFTYYTVQLNAHLPFIIPETLRRTTFTASLTACSVQGCHWILCKYQWKNKILHFCQGPKICSSLYQVIGVTQPLVKQETSCELLNPRQTLSSLSIMIFLLIGPLPLFPSGSAM